MRWRISNRMRALIGVAVMAVSFRLALPPLIEIYVRSILDDLPGYTCTFKRINVLGLQGAYQIDSLTVFKNRRMKKHALLNAEKVVFSLEWKSALKGQLRTRLTFHRPAINFLAFKTWTGRTDGLFGKETNWASPLRKMAIADINTIEVVGGTVAIHDQRDPAHSVALTQVNAMAVNLQQEGTRQLLPSRLSLHAQSSGNGTVQMEMNLNAAKEMPDLDLDVRFVGVHMPSVPQLFSRYSGLALAEGNLDVWAEVTLINGHLQGYVRPLLRNIRLSGVTLENTRYRISRLPDAADTARSEFATTIPLEGQLPQITSQFWPTLWLIFKNAFEEAFVVNTQKLIETEIRNTNLVITTEEAPE